MKLLKSVNYFAETYQARLVRMNEQVDTWLDQISKEKRLGLTPMFEADPYNTAVHRALPQQNASDDTVNFQPQPNVEKPVQKPGPNSPSMRVHLIYDPKEGKIEKVVKTPLRSRPPADYMEATADQVRGALKHLNSINPALAQKLVRGDMSVWIPRASAASIPSSAAHLGLNAGDSTGHTTMNLSPEDLASARAAANKMSLA